MTVGQQPRRGDGFGEGAVARAAGAEGDDDGRYAVCGRGGGEGAVDVGGRERRALDDCEALPLRGGEEGNGGGVAD